MSQMRVRHFGAAGDLAPCGKTIQNGRGSPDPQQVTCMRCWRIIAPKILKYCVPALDMRARRDMWNAAHLPERQIPRPDWKPRKPKEGSIRDTVAGELG